MTMGGKNIMNVRKLFEIGLGLPKSIILNFTQLPKKQAIRLPILVSYRTKFKSLKGNMYIKDTVKFGQIRIGLSGAGSGTAHYLPTVIENNGSIVFKGCVEIGGGCQICTVDTQSNLSIGNQTKFMGECHLVAAKSVTIGEECAISWNTQIMDTDFHSIYKDQKKINNNEDVKIGNHVWIASHCLILKGCRIPDNIVIAAGSLIDSNQKDSFEENTIITSLPYRILKRDISWRI